MRIFAHSFYHIKKNVNLGARILPLENCMWISAPTFLCDRVCMQWCLWACVCVCVCVRVCLCVHCAFHRIHFYRMKKECEFIGMHFPA